MLADTDRQPSLDLEDGREETANPIAGHDGTASPVTGMFESEVNDSATRHSNQAN